ncbi:MAG: hypothetical protein WAN14_09705 [Candidatus Acidiferrales bacterium]
MNTHAAAVAPHSREVLSLVLCGVGIALAVIFLALVPRPVDVSIRLADWFQGLLPHPIHLWKEWPWRY